MNSHWLNCVTMQTTAASSAAKLLNLSDDVLRTILRGIPKSHASLMCLAAVCRRFAALVVPDATMWVELRCGGHETETFGVGRPALRGGVPVVPLAVGVSERGLPNFGDVLASGLDLVHRAHRRSAGAVGVAALRLQRRTDLSAVVPGILFHIQMCAALNGDRVRAETLRDVTFCQCSLPSSLGRLLPHVTRLRFWECPTDAQGESSLVAGLAALRLSTLAWVGSDAHPVPDALLTLSPPPEAWQGLERLVLSLDGLQLDWGEDEEDPSWVDRFGSRLTELTLLGEPELAGFYPGLIAGLSVWRSLTVLQLARGVLSPCAAEAAPALLQALPPTLRSFGQVDLSWMSPTWFFDVLRALPRAEGAPPPLAGLRQLSVFVNSPGASREFHSHAEAEALAGLVGAEAAAAFASAAGGMGEADMFNSTASSWDFGSHCALSLICGGVASELPSLEVLYIEWYEEDEMEEGFARALMSLAGCGRLREVHLMRNNVNCVSLERRGAGCNGARAGRSAETAGDHVDMAARLRDGLPGVRVFVHEEARQTHENGPTWMLEDACGVGGETCRGLAVWHGGGK